MTCREIIVTATEFLYNTVPELTQIIPLAAKDLLNVVSSQRLEIAGYVRDDVKHFYPDF